VDPQSKKRRREGGDVLSRLNDVATETKIEQIIAAFKDFTSRPGISVLLINQTVGRREEQGKGEKER